MKAILLTIIYFVSLSYEASGQLTPLLRLPLGHGERMNEAISISPNHKRLLTSDPKKIIVWDINSGRSLKELTGTESMMCIGAEYSGDGQYILGLFRQGPDFVNSSIYILQWNSNSYQYLRKRMITDYEKFQTFENNFAWPTYGYPFSINISDLDSVEPNKQIYFEEDINQGSNKVRLLLGSEFNMLSHSKKAMIPLDIYSGTARNVTTSGAFGLYDLSCQNPAYTKKIFGKRTYLLPEKIYNLGNDIKAGSIAISPRNTYFATIARYASGSKAYLWRFDSESPIDSLGLNFRSVKMDFSGSETALYFYSDRDYYFTTWHFKKDHVIEQVEIPEGMRFKIPAYVSPFFVLTPEDKPGAAAFMNPENDDMIIAGYNNKVQPVTEVFFADKGTNFVTINSPDQYGSYYTDTMLYHIGHTLKRNYDWGIPDSVNKKEPYLFERLFVEVCKKLGRNKTQTPVNVRFWDLAHGKISNSIPSSFVTQFDTKTSSAQLSCFPDNAPVKNASAAKSNSARQTGQVVTRSALFRTLMYDSLPKPVPAVTKSSFSKQGLVEAIVSIYGAPLFASMTGGAGSKEDPSAKLISGITGDTLSLYAMDSTDWVITLPNGYYFSSPKGTASLYYTQKEKVINFEQLDLQYNRPDKILEAFGYADVSLLKAYRQAYYKRISALKIDTALFNNTYNVPQADLANRKQLLQLQKKDELQLVLQAVDEKVILDRYNIWVNEVPLYGKAGMSIKNKRTKKIDDLSVTIRLSEGRNKIEFSVTNANGLESLREPLIINYVPDKDVEAKTYFIGIGINTFASGTNALKWCVNDIRALASSLQGKLGKNFVLIDTLFNDQVVISNIRKLKSKLSKAKEDDKVIVVFSGHGLISAQYDYYLSGYTTNFKKPEEGGIAYQELEDILDGIASRKKILLLDACNSGEFDNTGFLRSSLPSQKGVPDSVEVVGLMGKFGLANSFELMKQLFINVSKGTGAIIIAAAQGYQSAMEQHKLEHGVFTYCILNAIQQNKTLTVDQLKQWVYQKVPQLTDNKQQPVSRTEPADVDWLIW